MSKVRRVYVEKMPAYAVQATALKREVKSYLGIKNVDIVRFLNAHFPKTKSHKWIWGSV